ncbi:MAG: TadE/TadG family type IV pilus assembly protein [Bradyrhizobium sp.]
MLRSALDMFGDRSGIAATEFAVIVPLMLVMFFGVVEFSSGVAVDRKVTLISRALSDLTAQTPSSSAQAQFAQVTDGYIQNVFTASIGIIQTYSPTPINARISEVYVDSTGVATIQWSRAAIIPSATATQATLTTSTRSPGDVVTTKVPAALLVKQTYMIWSEVSYLYKPTIGYVMAPAGVTLSDVAFTRPRQVACLTYPTISLYPQLNSGSCPLT